MFPSVRGILAAVVLACCALCAAQAGDDKGEEKPKPKPKQKEKFKLTAQETRVFELTNAEREKEMLKPYKLSPLLTKVAREHSANMAKQQKMDHKLDGKGPQDRLKAAGYKFLGWAENIYLGSDNPKVADQSVRWWMKSKLHRENILDPNLREIGVGIVRGKDGKLYFTQVFGTPPR
jgi:uncharacterized protein YkwD